MDSGYGHDSKQEHAEKLVEGVEMSAVYHSIISTLKLCGQCGTSLENTSGARF